MIRLLMALMVLATLTQFGMSMLDLQNCRSRACMKQFEARARDVLHVDWEPISVFPEEAKRFR